MPRGSAARWRARAPCCNTANAPPPRSSPTRSYLAAARKHLEDSPFLKIDYLELVDAETLQPVGHIKKPAVLAAAVFYGEVRLIDHVTLLP